MGNGEWVDVDTESQAACDRQSLPKASHNLATKQFPLTDDFQSPILNDPFPITDPQLSITHYLYL
jgi:hypothetical protein